MKKIFVIILIGCMLAGFTAPASAAAEIGVGNGAAIIRVDTGLDNIALPDTMFVDKSWDFGEYTLARICSKNTTSKQLADKLSAVKGVTYAEPDCVMKVQAVADEKWYLHTDDSTYEGGNVADIGIAALKEKTDTANKQEQVIAVVDTGVDYTHPDIAEHMWHNTTELPGKYGYDFMNQDDDPMDDFGHGTHCAGIIAECTENADGASSTDSNVKIMAIKNMDENGSGVASLAIEAYSYIINAKKQGVNVTAINNSWGTEENPKALEDIINTAGEMGILTVCAAGNLYTDLDKNKMFPAGYDSPYVIIVAASNPNDELLMFSNYGKYSVDVAAPGTQILSAYNREAYMPGLTGNDDTLHTFEDDQIPFESDRVSISQEHAFRGSKSMVWSLKSTPDEEQYYDSNPNPNYTNILEWDVDVKKKGRYFGLNFMMDAPDASNSYCYVESFQNGHWTMRGLFRIDRSNFWNTKWFELDKGVSKLHLIATGKLDGASLYIDDMGIGRSTGKRAFLSGTSMAAPMVAAETALLSQAFPDESPVKIRARVLGGVDKTLTGKVSSDGRVNFARACSDPYPVMDGLKQSDSGETTLNGYFFGEKKGALLIDGMEHDVSSWGDNAISFACNHAHEGYISFTVERADGASSIQTLILSNTDKIWKKHSPIPQTIQEAATVAAGGKIYVIGGSVEGEPVGSVYRYDPASDTWEKLCGLPLKESLFSYSYGTSAVATEKGILLLIHESDKTGEHNEFYLYSIENNEWTQLTMDQLPEPHLYATLGTLNGSVYMIGGIPSGENFGKTELTKGIWKLSDDLKSWEHVAQLSEGRYGAIAVECGGKLVITGGRVGDIDTVTSTEIFDGTTVSAGAPLPVSGLHRNNTVYGYDGSDVIVMTDGNSFGVAGLRYDVTTDSWSDVPYRMGFGKREKMSGGVIGDRIYVVGGLYDNRSLDSTVSAELQRPVQAADAAEEPKEPKEQNSSVSHPYWIWIAAAGAVATTVCAIIARRGKKRNS